MSPQEALDALQELGGMRRKALHQTWQYLPGRRLTTAEQQRLAFVCYRIGVLVAHKKLLAIKGADGGVAGWKIRNEPWAKSP